METFKFERLINLTTEENEALKDYIDKKIDSALEEIRNEIRELGYLKASKSESINPDKLLELIKGYRR